MKYNRTYNFSAGPAMMPEPVLEEIRDEMMNYRGSGMCVMEMSHRSKVFQQIVDEAEADLRDLMGILGNVKIGAVGNVAVVLVLGGSGDDDLAVLLSLGNGLLGPCAGLDVDGLAVLHQIPRHSRELQRSAALNEQDLVVVGDVHQLAQVGLGLVSDLLEHLGAVAHLHDAHTAAAVVHHLVPDLLQHGLRHHSGTGGEIECTTVFHLVVPPFSIQALFSLFLPVTHIIVHPVVRINREK